MNIREKNMDNLRILAALMVVLLHVSSQIVNMHLDDPNLYFTIGNLFDSFSRSCVNIFVMLSGAYILDNSKNKNYMVFYKKIFRNIIIPMLIWSFIYFVYSIINEIAGSIYFEKEMDIMINVINWINGNPFYHLWYLYMMIGLYFISPVLIRVKEDIGEKNTFRLGCILVLLGFFSSFTSILFWPILFIEYLGFFILGYSIRKYFLLNPQNPSKYILGFILSCFATFVFTELVVRNNWNFSSFYFYGNHAPFVISGALLLFAAFSNMRRSKLDFGFLAKHSFNIYLIHAGVLDPIRIIIFEVLKLNPNPLWYIPITTLLVFFLSYAGSLFVNWFIHFKIFNNFISK